MNIWLETTDHLIERWRYGLHELGHTTDTKGKPEIYITDSSSVRRKGGWCGFFTNKAPLKVLSINDEPRESDSWETVTLSEQFDVIVCPTLQTQHKFNRPMIQLPFTYHPLWHFPIDRKKEYDIVFIGRLDHKRLEFLHKFEEKYKVFKTDNCNWECNRETYARARIAIHLGLWSDNPQTNEKSQYQGCRYWHSLACGVFTVTERRGPEYIKNVKYFETYEEAREIIDYYLEHSDECDKIALAGLEEVQSHSVKNRMQELLDKLLIYIK